MLRKGISVTGYCTISQITVFCDLIVIQNTFINKQKKKRPTNLLKQFVYQANLMTFLNKRSVRELYIIITGVLA